MATGYGNPFINQIFALMSSYNVADFINPPVGVGTTRFDLSTVPDLPDGTSGKMQLALAAYPPTIDWATSGYDGGPDVGFLDHQQPWGWFGMFKRYNLDINTGDYVDPDGDVVDYMGLEEWLSDTDNLGGTGEMAASGWSTDSGGHDDRGWVYVDNDDDEYGIEGGMGIIRGNIRPSDITRTLIDATAVNGTQYEDGFTNCTRLDLSDDNPWAEPETAASSNASGPDYSSRFYGILLWECQITNFYDTMMSGHSILTYSHMIGDLPANQMQGFWDTTLGETPSWSDDNSEALVRLVNDYYTVNDNIILDYTNIGLLTPREVEYTLSSVYGYENPAETEVFPSPSIAASHYHGDEIMAADQSGTGAIIEAGRVTGDDGYSTPTMQILLNAGGSGVTAAGDIEYQMSLLRARFKTDAGEIAKFTAWKDSITQEIQNSLYASIGTKKYTVKMQPSPRLQKNMLSALAADHTQYTDDYASAQTAMAETTATSNTAMSPSPSTVGSSGYGGY